MTAVIPPPLSQHLLATGAHQPLKRSYVSDVLCEIGRVENLADLGTNGPLIASAGTTSLFHCLFGRDAIRMAMDLLNDFPAVAQTTLVGLARLQGVEFNQRSEEEPGRILHEHRHPDDPHAARLGAYWDFPYYGAVDATPQWINLLGDYCARYGTAILDECVTDRHWEKVTIRHCLDAATRWITSRLADVRCPGYLWVQRTSPYGIPNQVWEDSTDSYYFADGTLFDFTMPYAPVAVQGYAFDALNTAATLLEESALADCAESLRERVLRHYWWREEGTFALALAPRDGTFQQARVLASAPGHLLASDLLVGVPEAELLMDRLLAPDLLAGAGIRTKSTRAVRFNPGSYHNGSSWPMDTGVVADGFRRHGRTVQADALEARILGACETVGALPEFFRGDPDGSVTVNTQTVDIVRRGEVNRVEQPPQRDQGWTATRVWRILSRRAPC